MALDRANRELGTTTALITHNAGIKDMSERVIRFADGRIISVEENPVKKAPEELSW